MGGIAEDQIEWALVNRWKAMLDEPPETVFNVSQSFALFSTVVLWVKNRAWVGGNGVGRPDWFDNADDAARDARNHLGTSTIFDAPWLLSRSPPKVVLVEYADGWADELAINVDFDGMSAQAFFKWLRDAIAHGDGRTIRPLHKRSNKSNRVLLAGFRIRFAEQRGSRHNLTLDLYHHDMRRLGSALADVFCRSLSGGSQYFEQEAGTAAIVESERAA